MLCTISTANLTTEGDDNVCPADEGCLDFGPALTKQFDMFLTVNNPANPSPDRLGIFSECRCSERGSADGQPFCRR